MDYTIEQPDIRFKNGAFIRQFKWNTSVIIRTTDVKSGFIVQHIVRNTRDTRNIYADNEDYNHSYWEAWPVQDGRITLDDYGYNDRWTNVPEDWEMRTPEYQRKWLYDVLLERKKSTGIIKIIGQEFWAPHDDELEKIVMTTFKKGIVRWAGELQATREIKDSSRFVPLYEHEFHNSWKLENNEDYINAKRQIDEWRV
ncbi:MAG: hypothetical protein IJ119_03530 [Clostridia bacterium]|nr:hypothetical protein [Clostridia bacterium]